jgi:HK97 gp10 family phage protein
MNVELKGLKEVDAVLASLGAKDGARIVRRALTLAADPIVAQAKANAPVDSGALRESIGKKFSVANKISEASFAVEAQPTQLGSRIAVIIAPIARNKTAIALYNLVHSNRSKRRNGIFWGHFMEFGTKRDPVRRRFLGPALQSRAPEAIRIFAEQVNRGIAQQLRRNAKKGI